MQKISNLINTAIIFTAYLFGMILFSKLISDIIISTLIFNIILISIYIIYNKKKGNEIKFTKLDNKNIILMGSIFLILILLSNNISAYILMNVKDNAFNSYANTLTNSNTILVIISALIISPIAEEIFFRGIIFKYLKKDFSFIFATIISVSCFALMHGTIIHIVPAVIMGTLFCEIYEYTKDIKYNIFFHMLYNILIMSIGAISFITNKYLIIICGILSLTLLVMYGKYIIDYENR